MFDNTMLEIKVDKDMVKGLVSNIIAYADMKGVALPNYLLPNEWGGPQDESYENFKEYIYELYRRFPDEGVIETYMHPSLETDDLKGTSSCWERRVWEYQLLKDPQTRQHIESLGFKLINYRDLAKLR